METTTFVQYTVIPLLGPTQVELYSPIILKRVVDQIDHCDRRLTKKACVIWTQNSTAIPTDITRLTTDTALSWIFRIAITPCKTMYNVTAREKKTGTMI